MTLSRNTFDSVNAEFAAHALGAKMKEVALASVSSEHLGNEAERLRRTLSQTHSVRQKRFPVGVWLAAAAVLGAVALGGTLAFERLGSTLTVDVSTLRTQNRGAVVHVTENHLVAPLGDAEELRFSDGSRVIVSDGSRLRIHDLKKNGASLLLEKGSAHVHVIHRRNNTDWHVSAGPFSIAVVGTRFDVNYNPVTEKVRVDLQEGRVEINGPKFASPAVLRSGQRFEASSGIVGWSVTPLGVTLESEPSTDGVVQGTSATAKEVRTEEALSKGATPVVKASRAVSSRPSSKERDRAKISKLAEGDAVAAANTTSLGEGRQWSKLVSSGEFKQVTREADAMGLMVCLSNCSAADLRALADASRYTGRLDTAEAALRVLHDKYPPQSTTASYLLGVVDEARGRNSSALHWYEEYLSKTNTGGFVAEAKAARLRMLVATGGQGAARQAAREYLEAYPHGAASGLASKVLEGR